MARLFFSLLLCFCVVFLCVSDILADSSHKKKLHEFERFLEDAKKETQRFKDAIDPSDFEIKAKAKQLGNQIEPVFEYVRDSIQYEPYAGVLRGASGCLRSKAGNSFDQALLLHTLLTLSGHKVKFVFGQLTPQIAEELIDKTWHRDVSLDHSLDLPYYIKSPVLIKRCEEGILKYEKHLKNRFDTLFSALKESLDTPLITETTKEEEEAFLAKVLKEIEPHLWVQVFKDGKWIDLDPAVSYLAIGESIVKEREEFLAIPQEYWHQITFEGFSSTLKKKKVLEQTLFQTTYNIAELPQEAIVITCPSLKSTQKTVAKPTSQPSSQPRSRNTSQPEKTKIKRELSVTLRGKNIAKKQFVYTPPLVILQGKNNKIGGLGGTLGGGLGGKLRGKKAQYQLFTVDIGVRLILKNPDGSSQQVTRYFLDHWGNVARQKNDLKVLRNIKTTAEAEKLSYQKRIYLALKTGKSNASLLQHKVLTATLKKAEAFQVKGNKLSYENGPETLSAYLFCQSYAFYLERFAQKHLNIDFYTAKPQISTVIVGESLQYPGLLFDVTTSEEYRFFPYIPSKTKLKNFQIGLLSSIIEEELSFGIGKTRWKVGSAFVLESSLKKEKPQRVSSASQLPKISPKVRYYIEKQLAQKQELIIPSVQLPKKDFTWYAFNPKTGHLRAWIETGYHQAYSEYETQQNESGETSKAGASAQGSTLADKMGCVVSTINSAVDVYLTQGSPNSVFDLTASGFECIIEMLDKGIDKNDVLKVNDRHKMCRVMAGTNIKGVKDKNTVVEPGAWKQMLKDVAHINNTVIKKGDKKHTSSKNFNIGNRSYAYSPGHLSPKSGPGYHNLNKSEYRALGFLNVTRNPHSKKSVKELAGLNKAYKNFDSALREKMETLFDNVLKRNPNYFNCNASKR